jgi:hypothetical protein
LKLACLGRSLLLLKVAEFAQQIVSPFLCTREVVDS